MCPPIALGLVDIAHSGALTKVSFKSCRVIGAKGDRYGVPKDLKEDRWMTRNNNPIKIPKPPNVLAAKRNKMRKITPTSFWAGTTKEVIAVNETIIITAAVTRPADTAA